ncbi:prokaryotic molybdopterin-containing oxidoreductase family, membrane subunit [Desulfonatronum thiosulfatophilum]|uniref:Prokaryotic molybdopterin-containing oxidoreductase family, membrane subunit n=1 Tax=Desulfonatronum thiosulfatophilum TaxID=617002 RepID=A0A1G6E7P9_9BACT|nr:NrfD/PsrC family molybdoenzyme membrane anchor subunit [Desulfonatronum thiosulfatophilum]SDB53350.1 prokaryotic molybdopterin-containing oxidoreductase family, membrane subunit [Desulfonatronum thiosulfatophilum]
MSKLWFGLLGVGLLFGLFSALTVVSQGLGVYNANDVTFWVLPMSGYLFFALTAAGLTFLSSLPSVFGMKMYYPIAKRSALLAGATLLVGVMCKALDLGPWTTLLNTIHLVLSPNLASPIWWMANLYAIYIAFVAFKFYTIHKGQWHTASGKTAGLLALGLMLMSYTALSIVFGTADARPAFFGHFTALYFMASAITSGLAVLFLASMVHFQLIGGMPKEQEPIFQNISRFFAIMLAVSLFVFILRAVIGYTSLHEAFDGFRYIAGTALYKGELWLGLIIPLVMLLIPAVRDSTIGRVLVSIFVLAGMFAGRLVMLLSAQIRPVGAFIENRPEFVSYVPSIYEIGIIVLALSLALLIYSIGVKYWKLEATPD